MKHIKRVHAIAYNDFNKTSHFFNVAQTYDIGAKI